MMNILFKLLLLCSILLLLFGCATEEDEYLKIDIQGRVKIKNYDEYIPNCTVKIEDSYSPFMGWTTTYTTMAETTSDDSGKFNIIYEPTDDQKEWYNIRITCDETIIITDSTGYAYNSWDDSKYTEYYKDITTGTTLNQDFELQARAYLKINFHTNDPLSTGDTLVVYDIGGSVHYTTDPISRSCYVPGGNIHSYRWKIKRDGGEFLTFTDSIKCEKFVVTEVDLIY
jgi:hypothetical protein